jgi:uncharacterized integral membrane protein
MLYKVVVFLETMFNQGRWFLSTGERYFYIWCICTPTDRILFYKVLISSEFLFLFFFVFLILLLLLFLKIYNACSVKFQFLWLSKRSFLLIRCYGKKKKKIKKNKFNRPINYGIYWWISEGKVISYGTNVFRQSRLNETKTW